jgi:hypothetical protein
MGYHGDMRRRSCSFVCIATVLGLSLASADAACPRSGPKAVPGTLAAANAGCDVNKPAPARAPDEGRRRDEPGVVIRSGNTEIRMRGYLQTDVGTGGMVGRGR